MPKRVSTARGREFGAGLRAALANAGLTSRAAAEVLDWDEAKVSGVVNGKGGASQVDVALLLGVCRVKTAEVEHLLSLYGETHCQGWWQQHGTCAPIRSRTVEEHLKVVKSLTGWHTHTVPLFLQTIDYLREVLIASSTSPAEELEERVHAQLALQEPLWRGVPCTFFIHEFALRLRIGGAEVHIGQLLHLLHMANRQNITVRIMPAAIGAHAGMAGLFSRLTFEKYETLVWVETQNSSLFVETADAIEGYQQVVEALDARALDEADSKALVVNLYETLL